MPFTPSRVLCLSLVASLLLVGGCEQSYKPAPYKAAPRVSVGDSDVTEWTSPEAVARAGSANPAARGYRGMGAYRGISGYRGMGGYRSTGSYRGIKSYRGLQTQRGGSGFRVYRGIDSKPVSASKYRGY